MTTLLRALLCAALLVGAAHASIFDIYGFGPRGRAMGNAQAAAADDFTAAFYNPGALTRRKKVCAGAGFIATFPGLTIDRDYSNPAQREVGEQLPPNFSGVTLGALFPLGGKFDDRVAIGVALYLPTLNLLRGEGIDPRVPQLYRYQNLPDKFVVLGAMGLQLTDWLSVGMGVQVLATLDGQVEFDLEFANRRVTSRSVKVEVRPTAAPTMGLDLKPIDDLHVGLVWRDAIQLDYALPVSVHIDELISLDLALEGTVLYTPETYGLGVAYLIAPIDLLVSAQVDYVRWSKAPDPSPVFELNLSGDILDGLGLGERLDVGRGASVVLNFVDVLKYSVGVEQTPHPQVKLRAGYTWRPSPAPVPTEAFNYLDPDAHVVALGAGFTFADPLEIRRNPMHLDVVYQATVMVTQEVRKRLGAADAVGDYTASGAIHSVGVAFRHDL